MDFKKTNVKKSSFKKNVVANLIGRFWGMISLYLFIPLYIHFLGMELYGLVSFFATLQGMMYLLSAGLSTTLRREFSSGEDVAGNRIRKYKLLKSIEIFYFIIACIIILLCYFCANYIAKGWLKTGTLDVNTVIMTIRLMGVSIAFQIIGDLYSGGLLGLEFQVETNIIQITWSVLKNVVVVLILWLISPDIRLFYLWFIFVDLLYVIALRHYLLKALQVDNTFTWNFSNLNNLSTIWKFTIGILVISILSVFNTQLDKIVISKFLDISDLGIYNLSYALSQLPVIGVTSISVAIFSKFAYYYSILDKEKLIGLFKDSYKTLTIFSVSVSIYMSFYSKELLLIWTHNAIISEKGCVVVSLIVIGSMFLAMQVIPYNLALACGNTRINTRVGLISIVILIPSVIILVTRYGIIGAAICWLLNMSITTIFYNCIVYREFVDKHAIKWFIKQSVLPMILTVIVAMFFYAINRMLSLSLIASLTYGIFTGLITFIILILVLDRKAVAYAKVIFLKLKLNLH